MSKKERIYLITYDNTQYRYSEPCSVIGVKRITTYKRSIVDIANEPIDCYHVKYEDGEEGYIPINDLKLLGYHFVTLRDMLTYGKP